MSILFNKIVRDYFEPQGFKVTELQNTSPWNVMRLYEPQTKKYYVVKGILHIDGDKELGIKQMDKAYKNETSILSKLPKWWGLYLKEHFIKYPFRIIVIPELSNFKWDLYKGNNDTLIANNLYKQIKWLHNNKIAHNDLEVKNILLNSHTNNVIIIDFEKSIKNASMTSMLNDFKKIINNLKSFENTKGIADKLERLRIKDIKKTKKTNNMMIYTLS